MTNEQDPMLAYNPTNFGTSKLHLLTLPPELLLHICSYLKAKFVIKTLSQVCKALNELVKDESTWRIRVAKRFPKPFPILPADDVFDWQTACIEREEKFELWCEPEETMDHFTYREEIFAPVDAVHLMKNGQLLASGSRDRYLNLIDVTKLESGDPVSVKASKVESLMDAHKGWIWSLASVGNSLCSGSWDTYIKFWDLNAPQLQTVNKIKLKSAVLCMHYEEGELFAGGFDKKTYRIDPRTSSIVSEFMLHKKPVLCMVADEKHVITGGEDETIYVLDRRSNGVLKSINIGSFAMSMCYNDGQLWVGDKTGHIHLLDPKHGKFDVVQSYETGQSGKITDLHNTLGAIFSASTDKTVNVLEPNENPGVISQLKFDMEAASLSYQDNTLA
ncbi:unnamed protein product, partial [Owenia fusiformis]